MNVARVAVSDQIEACQRADHFICIEPGVGRRGQSTDTDERQSIEPREARVARGMLDQKNGCYRGTLAYACETIEWSLLSQDSNDVVH